MYDAIIVGARCAGATTAMLLARQGLNVLLVDKAIFPKDIPHGHFIHRSGPERLARWELLEPILATGCPAVTTFTTDLDDFPLTGTGLHHNGLPYGLAPRRSALDAVLVREAAAAGAELRDGFVVDEFVSRQDQIVGIRGRDLRRGTAVTELATITIGADGRNSKLAQMVKPETTEVVPPLTCWYFSYWSEIPDNGLEIYVRGQRAIFVFPTNDGLTGIFIAWGADQMTRIRQDIDLYFWDVLDEVPELAARLRAGTQVERFAGASDVPNFFRKPFGPGWALAGDAGHHKDPYMALGISDALRDADYLSQAIVKGLNGPIPLAQTLSEYEAQRNRESLPLYHENMQKARFVPAPPAVKQLRQALAHQPEATRDFYAVFEGLQPAESFFNPENMGRLMARAGAA